MSVSIKLAPIDRIFRAGDLLLGSIIVSSKGSMSHSGISIHLDGEVVLQLSSKSVGVFEAFYNSLKPIKLLDYKIDLQKSGKFPDGVTEIPFEFKLEPLPGQQLYDTYHGVFVNIQYTLQVDIIRGLLAKNLQSRMEFIIEAPAIEPYKETPITFVIKPERLENIKKSALDKVPKFHITGSFKSATLPINKPLVGEVIVQECEGEIKSIELQLIRVETCGCAEGFAKESTEIQNIQIADGNVSRGLAVPIYMVFPRLFTCQSVSARTFKVEFEMNLVVVLTDGLMISENIPIKLTR